jgi:hypothetical protein
MRPERASTHEAGGDRGVSLVLVALLAVAVLLLAAVAIDGGSAYANRRQMQNAADAGAFAGTRAVEKLRFGGETDGGTIWDAVESTRETNDADSMRCWLVGPVTTAGTPPSRITADVCTDEATMASAWASLPNGGDEVAGVEVEQTAVRDTYFARVTGNDTTTARASAIATLQPLAGTVGGTPFLVCSSSENDADGFDIWDFDTNRIRPGAITDPETGEPVLYGLQGAQNEKVPDCGAGSDAFDGTGGEMPATATASTRTSSPPSWAAIRARRTWTSPRDASSSSRSSRRAASRAPTSRCSSWASACSRSTAADPARSTRSANSWPTRCRSTAAT